MTGLQRPAVGSEIKQGFFNLLAVTFEIKPHFRSLCCRCNVIGSLQFLTKDQERFIGLDGNTQNGGFLAILRSSQ
ncbi:hypothetical protein LL06_24500 [Hoeflea sp. BAL378]|nr:hypothetical protein LL06_24500 [Hoeflea sp. BAL378]